MAVRIAESALRVLARSLRLLPLPLLLWLGRRLGSLAYWTLAGRRALAGENLALAFGGERGSDELDRLCRGSFEHLGMTAVEVCASLFASPAAALSRVRVEGLHHLNAAMARGKGVLLLTAHLGNWELLAATHGLSGHPLSIVVRPLDSSLLDRLVTRARERSGAGVIRKHRALREVLDALRRQRMVGILLDQNATRREGVFVPFFGRPASTSKSLALLALRSGAPVLPVFIHREADGSHRVVIEPEVPPPRTGDHRHDIVAYTAAFTRCVEDAVRRWPEQWFWVHRRWRTRPV
ncbi:MAG: lysophospholipid acyltransferase family protein [Candidatus Rokubacteria bacterium]|nr:lysophospholipid acyltransferase family protein [Candidatus Rokubacteria bacterium]